MARKNRRIHYENKNATASEINPLSMIKPSVIGTPLGMLPILPIPSLDDEDSTENPDKNDNDDRLS